MNKKDLEYNPGVIYSIAEFQREYNQLVSNRIKLLLNPPLMKQNRVGLMNLMMKILRIK